MISNFIDLTGMKFGKLTVIRFVDRDKSGAARWKCRCECGNTTISRGKDMKRGKIVSCGCGRKGKNAKDLTGLKFGNLTAIRPIGRKRGNILWLCKCDCGRETSVITNSLTTGLTKTCGHHAYHITHGMTHTRLYRIWAGMISRCKYKSASGYENYGGRGISVCDEWSNSFETFKDWAFSNGYLDNLTIERKDVNGNYEPNNCKWIPRGEQQNNKRNNHMVTINGTTKNISSWCKEYNLNRYVLTERIKRGWTGEELLIPALPLGCKRKRGNDK